MQKIMSRIALTTCMALFAASCADIITPQTEETSTAQAESAGAPSADGTITIRTYFLNGEVVGVCTISTCVPRGTTCSGIRTNDFQDEPADVCDGTPPHPGPGPNPKPGS